MNEQPALFDNGPAPLPAMCDKGPVSHGEATDVLARWPACTLWERAK